MPFNPLVRVRLLHGLPENQKGRRAWPLELVISCKAARAAGLALGGETDAAFVAAGAPPGADQLSAAGAGLRFFAARARSAHDPAPPSGLGGVSRGAAAPRLT